MGIFMLLPLLLWALFWVGVLGGGGYLLLRAVRAMEARSGGGASGALADRVRVLEDALQRMEGQMEELAEAHRFTTRLLTERAGGGAGAAGGPGAPATPALPNVPDVPDAPGAPPGGAAP